MDKYIEEIELDNINLDIKDIETVVSGLASGKYDLHTIIYAPLQSDYYAQYMGREILFQHEFIDSFKSILLVNKNSKLTINDLGRKQLTLYLSTKDRGSYRKIVQLINNAGLDINKVNFVEIGNEEKFRRLKDEKNAIADTSKPSYLFTKNTYNKNNPNKLDVQVGFNDDFPISHISPAVNKDFATTSLYKNSLRDPIDYIDVTNKMVEEIGPKIAKLNVKSKGNLIKVAKDWLGGRDFNRVVMRY